MQDSHLVKQRILFNSSNLTELNSISTNIQFANWNQSLSYSESETESEFHSQKKKKNKNKKKLKK